MVDRGLLFPVVLVVTLFAIGCHSDVDLPRVLPPQSMADDIVPDCEELRVGEARFYGSVDPAAREMTYVRFGVSLVRDPNGIGAPTFLRVGQNQIRLREATPDRLSAVGILERGSVSPPRRIFGVSLPGTDAGVDLAFVDGRVDYLSARCYRDVTCDFAIGWEGFPMVTFPVRESVLQAALPSAGTVSTCRSPF